MIKKAQDHRPHTARLRRERMHQHILSVVQENFYGPSGKLATLDEIIRYAKISKGTFYKYFNSLDDAVAELGAELARQMIIDMGVIYEPVQHPVERVAIGGILFLYRALSDHRWGACIGHIHNLSQDNLLLSYILADLEAGKNQGFFKFGKLEIAANFILDIMIQAARHISEGQGSRRFIQEIMALLLRSIGTTEGLARRSLNDMERQFMREGAANLQWWCPIEEEASDASL